MNVYQAINEAADHIEKNPNSYNFSKNSVPKNLTDDGCALGWICYFKYKHRFFLFRPSNAITASFNMFRIGGIGPFCNRMNNLSYCDNEFRIWISDPVEVCHRLREYAEKYHQSEKPTVLIGIPDNIRTIFTQQVDNREHITEV